MADYFKYKIQRRKDGTFDIVAKNLTKKKNNLTIHGNYDSYDDAHDELVDLHYKPSQAEAIEMIQDLRNKLDEIQK